MCSASRNAFSPDTGGDEWAKGTDILWEGLREETIDHLKDSISEVHGMDQALEDKLFEVRKNRDQKEKQTLSLKEQLPSMTSAAV